MTRYGTDMVDFLSKITRQGMIKFSKEYSKGDTRKQMLLLYCANAVKEINRIDSLARISKQEIIQRLAKQLKNIPDIQERHICRIIVAALDRVVSAGFIRQSLPDIYKDLRRSTNAKSRKKMQNLAQISVLESGESILQRATDDGQPEISESLSSQNAGFIRARSTRTSRWAASGNSHYSSSTMIIDKSIKSKIVAALDACHSHCYAEFDISNNLVSIEPDNQRRKEIDQLLRNNTKRPAKTAQHLSTICQLD